MHYCEKKHRKRLGKILAREERLLNIHIFYIFDTNIVTEFPNLISRIYICTFPYS